MNKLLLDKAIADASAAIKAANAAYDAADKAEVAKTEAYAFYIAANEAADTSYAYAKRAEDTANIARDEYLKSKEEI